MTQQTAYYIRSTMSLITCVGSRERDTLLHAVEEAVKDSAPARLHSLLGQGVLSPEELNHRNLLHQAAWLGYPNCVQLLIDHGTNPDEPHRQNGCTPLHLAHFCTIEDTNPERTIQVLISAGASINNPGSHKCGKHPIDHAIQHQRLDSVQILLSLGAQVTLQSVLIAIDVANSQILELLLINGGDCGNRLDSHLFWGQPLHRVLYTPLKCPRECYKQMFRLLVQASVCKPFVLNAGEEPTVVKVSSNVQIMIESELRSLSREYVDLTQYLYTHLIRNGFRPSDTTKQLMNATGRIEWLDEYLRSPQTLNELCVALVRACVHTSGNILHGISKLQLPSRLKNSILIINPL